MENDKQAQNDKHDAPGLEAEHEERCSSCYHWHRFTHAGTKIGTGECRERSPSAVPVQTPEGLKLQSYHPPTMADHWCGGWKAPARVTH